MHWRTGLLLRCVIIALAVAASPVAAKAGLITYDFSVTATTGPLAGTSSSGSFSFDSSIIPAGGGEIDQNPFITALNFTWHGVSYTAATANACQAFFSATGALVGISFSGQNFPGGCGVESGHEAWNVEWLQQSEFFSADFFVFTYAVPGHFGDEFGTASLTPAAAVPEPSTLVLFGAGLVALGHLLRRRKSIA